MDHAVMTEAVNEILYRQSVRYLQKKKSEGYINENQYRIAEGYLAEEYRVLMRIC